MKNPKSFSTFLDGFNLGTFLSLLSLVTLLMQSPTIQEYMFIMSLRHLSIYDFSFLIIERESDFPNS